MITFDKFQREMFFDEQDIILGVCERIPSINIVCGIGYITDDHSQFMSVRAIACRNNAFYVVFSGRKHLASGKDYDYYYGVPVDTSTLAQVLNAVYIYKNNQIQELEKKIGKIRNLLA